VNVEAAIKAGWYWIGSSMEGPRQGMLPPNVRLTDEVYSAENHFALVQEI